MRPGMSFGELTLVTEGPRFANVRALVDTACQEIHFRDIDGAPSSGLGTARPN